MTDEPVDPNEPPVCPNGYREEHTFPSGLKIDYYTEIDKLYLQERDAIATDADILSLRERWRYLFPEIVGGELDAQTFIALNKDMKMQGDYANRATKEPLCADYLNILFPRTLLALVLPALNFQASTGLVLLQMWNAGVVHEAEDGTWTIQRPSEARSGNKGQ